MATTNDVLKKLSVAPKEVRYLNKSFVDFKGDLITFIKNYYPTTWTDFNEANPGMIMLELAAYVGDVLSFYVDNSFKENLLAYAEEEKNIIAIAQSLGYKPKTIVPATAEVLISQIVPALGATDGYIPDATYFLKIDRNSTISAAAVPSTAVSKGVAGSSSTRAGSKLAPALKSISALNTAADIIYLGLLTG